MKIAVITSFNQEYYNKIGQACVDSWLKYWPADCKLFCYVEEFNFNTSDPRIVQTPFTELPSEYNNFQADERYNDRVKVFAKKAYSIIHAFDNVECDRMIWLDADTITNNPIPKNFLETLCLENTLATFMGVWHHRDRHDETSELMFSGETGVFVVNKNHPGFKDFANRYKQYYNQGITENLRRFYDGEVFGAVVKEFENTYSFRDLAAETGKRYHSPLPRTPLGKYLTHYKSKHAKEDFVYKRAQ